MNRDFLYSSIIIVFLVIVLWVVAFFFGLVLNLMEQEQCKRSFAHSYSETVAVPFYYAYWIGCELSEPRFNIGKEYK